MRKVLSFAVSFVVLLMLSASQMSCSDPDEKNPGGTPTDTIPSLIAVATIAADYSAANFEIALRDYTVKQNLLPGLYTDLVIRAHGKYVYILERYGRDKVIKYDSKDRKKEYEEVLGPDLNIQDIAVVSDTKAYISALESSALIVFNPTTGKKTSPIDLSSFNTYAGTDSAETTPFASALAVYNGYVYVACQRLKTVDAPWGGTTFVPGDTSLIVVIDSRTDAVSTSIKLKRKNPASMDVSGDMLLVSSSGDWYDPDIPGGVELIDLTNNTNLRVAAEQSAFGAPISNVVFVSLTQAYIKAGSWGDTQVFPLDPTSGTVGAKIADITDADGGLAYDGTKLYVGERGGEKTGVLVINPNTNAVERTISTGLPPSSIAVIFGD